MRAIHCGRPPCGRFIVGGRHAGDDLGPNRRANGALLSLMARSDSLQIYGLILSTLLNTLRFTSGERHPNHPP